MWILIVILILAAVYLYLIAPAAERPDDSSLRGWLYAHRGLHDGNVKIPENSMAAFRLAVEKGYGMELDVQLTRDRQLVVHHDGSLKRVCGVDKLIRELDYAELPPLPDGSAIPLLSDVLAMVDGRAPIIVEVKHHGSPWANAEAAWALLKDYQGPFCMESFNPVAMKYFRQNAPHIVRGQLAYGGRWDPDDLDYPSYFALKNLLVNVVSRPHFIAYSAAADHTLSMWLMKHLFKPYLAGWTIRSQSVLDEARKQGYQYPIFEKFVPDEKER